MRAIISSFIPWTCALSFLIAIFPTHTLRAQCGNPNWKLNNDCGDIQASGGLAPDQPTIFCAGETVVVENNSSPANEITMTYIDWGDGTCEAFQGLPPNFSHAYVFPNDTCLFGGQITFTVRMGVEKDCGTAKSFNYITFPVAVRFKPLVIITASDLVTCAGSEIDFTSSVCANGVVQYQWIIDGDTITSPNVPGYVFNDPGTYNVSLTVTNTCGQGGTAIDVVSSGPASAGASASATNVCAPDTVVFTNNSTNALGQTWDISPATGWSFVNGTNNLSVEPAVLFTMPGVYTVHLAVDGCGNPEWESVITVLEPPSLNLPAKPDACDNGPLAYVPNATIGGSMPEVSWEFQGGTPATGSGPNPDTVFFNGVGQYIVKVTVTVAGCGTVSQADTFSIISLPSVSLQPVPDQCNSNPPVQLTATPAGNGWSGPGVSPSGLFHPGGIPDSLLQHPVPLVFQTGSGDCIARDTLFVLVNGLAVDAGPDQALCIDAGSVTLSAIPAGGDWAGKGVTAAGVFDPVLAGPGKHALVYSVLDTASACVSTDTLTATVQALPDAVLGQIDDRCVGVAFDLGAIFSGSAGSTCHWDFGDGSSADSCAPIHIYKTVGTYTISLLVENAAGCRDSAVGSVEIVPPPTAVFTTDRTEGCADLTLNIDNKNVMAGAMYVWDYGNGQRDTIDQPGPIVFGTGLHDTTYTIVLQAVNQCGMAALEQVITVHPRPQANFGTDFSSGCSPMEVNFNNVTVGEPDFFNWYINGAAAGSGFQLPQQVFYASDHDSTYSITLVAGNGCGTDTVTHTVLVKPNEVNAFFNTDTLSGCQPLTVHLTDYSTTGTNVSWNLGDGNLVSGDTVIHIYEQPGQYTIQEFANNGCGADTAAVTVTVLPQPVVSFAHAAYGCQGDTLHLNNTSQNLAGSVWDFGDGSRDSTHTSPAHVYAQTGFFTITLTGTSVANACTASSSHTIEVKPLPNPSATVLDSFGCQPFVFHALNTSSGTNFYVWDFGDGAFSTEFSPTHTYESAGAFTVRLEMADLFGCRNTWSYAPVNVFPKPTAQFQYDQADLCTTPAVIQLQNLSLNAGNYLWDFGPLGGSNLANPSISVPDPMTLSVELMAENGYHCRDTTVQTVKVYTKPVLDFSIGNARGCSPLAVLFENASFGVNQYAWDFGDGGTSDEAEPLHVFGQAGVYPVTLYASADSICFDSLRFDNFVQVLLTPTAGFTYAELTDTTVTPNGILRFFDASANATHWHWDFGDGDSSNLRNPVHRFVENGPRIVTLIATNGSGCSDTAAVQIMPERFGTLYIPNALSPDSGDPGSRYFQPMGAGLAEFEMAIFASNGQRVWHTSKIEKGMPVEYWDGTFNGTPLPQGLYWWKGRGRYVNGRLWEGMSYDGKAPVLEGKVLLLR